MVRLVPPFLRNIIGSSDPVSSSAAPKDDGSSQKSSNSGNKSDVINFPFSRGRKSDSGTPKFGNSPRNDSDLNDSATSIAIDSSDSIKDERLESLEVTSNIATIASIDWGPPKLNPNVLDELGNSGRYLLDRIRGNKLTLESPELLKKNIKNVPKVYESDFNVYLDQMNKIEATDFGVLGEPAVETDAGAKVLDNEEVSREYFEDGYSLNDNSVFNNELDMMPKSIESLESQLMVINNQLRELVGTHLKHVGESFVCIQDLKDSYSCVNDQLVNVRSVFDNLKGIYHSPMDYHSFKASRSNSKFGRHRYSIDDSIDSADGAADVAPNSVLANDLADSADQSTIQASNAPDTPLSASGSVLTSMNSSSSDWGKNDGTQSLAKRGSKLKQSESYTLHEVLVLKLKIMDVLDYLMILRGVVCTPEYLQGLVSNDMALARIFVFCALEYFKADLAKFTLTNSVNLVLNDTIVNLERVAEAKFIDLCFYALTQCYASDPGSGQFAGYLSSQASNAGSYSGRSSFSACADDGASDKPSSRDVAFENGLKATFEKMEPVLIVLAISGLLDAIFENIQVTKISPVEFKAPIALDSFSQNLDLIFSGFECSNLFLLHLLECVKSVCIQNRSGAYFPEPESACKIIEKMIFKIHESFPDGINRDYQKIEETTQLFKSELNLPPSFKNQKFNYYGSFYSDWMRFNEAPNPSLALLTPNSGSIANSVPEPAADDSDSTQNLAHEELLSMRGYFEKLFCTIEKLFLKSVENLFNNLLLSHQTGSDVTGAFDEMEHVLSLIKRVEEEYRGYVKGSICCLNTTNRLFLSKIVNADAADALSRTRGGTAGSIAFSSSVGANLERNLMKMFYNFVNAQVKGQVGGLFEQSLVEVHENLNSEKWEEFEKIDLEGRVFNLINSAVSLSDHLDIYFNISEKFPFLATITVSKSINLFAYFNTLIENELEKNLSVKKLCLIIQTLDYFIVLIPLKIKFISSLSQSKYNSSLSDPNGLSSHRPSDAKLNLDGFSVPDSLSEFPDPSLGSPLDPDFGLANSGAANSGNFSPDSSRRRSGNCTAINSSNSPMNEHAPSLEDYDKLVVLGINAENCVMESKLLRSKSLNLLSNFIFSQIKMYLINWVFRFSDIGENESFEGEGSEEVDMVIKTIEDLYVECSEFCTVEDLKSSFGDSFDKLVELLKKQNVEVERFNKFSDDCSKIITSLSHLTHIKLEILSLAHRLSS